MSNTMNKNLPMVLDSCWYLCSNGTP